MKILTKNGFKFAVGMFWQIPDYARKTVNLGKVYKDTGNDMFCQISNLNQTVGFCSKTSIQGEKNVASLGKFIIESAKLTSDYAASIICYKFKSKGEIDDEGKQLQEDLFGYLVLLNGTICPIDGEYVGEFELVRNSIVDQAKLYPVNTLYLPIDVADRFLNIFERLEYAYHTDEPNDLLIAIMRHANFKQLESLYELINISNTTVPDLTNYLEKRIKGAGLSTFDDELNLNSLKKIINSEAFRLKIRDNVQIENNIRYLVASILQVPLSSDEIFWNNKLRQNHNKCRLYSIMGNRKKLYLLLIGVIVLGLSSYGIYDSFFKVDVIAKTLPVSHHNLVEKELSGPTLIQLCFGNGSDKFFGDLGSWTLIAMKCSSLGAEYQFKSFKPMTEIDLSNALGVKSGVSVNANMGKYTKQFNNIRDLGTFNKVSRDLILSGLQQNASDYNYKLQINSSKDSKISKFKISSSVSPLFLLQHGVLDKVKLKEINMKLNNSTSTYAWDIQGEY